MTERHGIAEVVVETFDAGPHRCRSCHSPRSARYITIIGKARHPMWTGVLCTPCRAFIGTALAASASAPTQREDTDA
jgi:hypothetical protein